MIVRKASPADQQHTDRRIWMKIYKIFHRNVVM